MAESDNGRDDLSRLRRFALAIGVVLFTYAIAGVELDSPAKISPLGIPLVVRRPNILGIGLIVTSVYAVIRYWYYAMVIGVSPMRARRRLKHGRVPNPGGRGFVTLGEISEEYAKGVGRYFPGAEAGSDGKGGNVVIGIRAATRILALIENIDFTAPIWLNGIALAIYAVVRLVR